MKYSITLFFLLIMSFNLNAQVEQPSLGSGYANFTYYNLQDGNLTTHDHAIWDIAFSVGTMDLGVFVNEGVGVSFAAPLPQVELYLTTASDFSDVDTTGMTRIYNDEISWSSGAFNHVRDTNNPADYGWGLYDFTTHQVNGNRVFVIKLRNQTYKKLEIQSLISGAYTFRYADIDGNNEGIRTIHKSDFENKTLAYFSLETDSELDVEPAEWDLLFTRYLTPLDDGTGGIIDYIVSGVLSNKGVSVAQADHIDPMTVAAADYEGQYSDTLTAIGHDWKSFQGAWEVPQDRVYFIKTKADELWKVQFYDFEGSSTGTATLERTYLGDITGLDELSYQNLASFDIFPNPTTNYSHVSFETTQSVRTAQLHLFNPLGQLVSSQTINTQNGLNVSTLELNYPKGIYQLTLKIGQDTITKTILIQ